MIESKHTFPSPNGWLDLIQHTHINTERIVIRCYNTFKDSVNEGEMWQTARGYIQATLLPCCGSLALLLFLFGSNHNEFTFVGEGGMFRARCHVCRSLRPQKSKSHAQQEEEKMKRRETVGQWRPGSDTNGANYGWRERSEAN